MIPYGYKQTEVGVIPEDWSVSALEKLYNITSSKRVFQSQWRKSGVPFYRAREIAVMSEGKIAPEDLYIDESLYNQYIHQYGSINKNDILITGVGTLGKVYVVKENDRFYFKDGNIIWLQAKHDFSSIYLKYQYDMPALINQVFGNAGGSTVATYTITNAKTTKVPVPPLQEQHRIAEALSDVDGMISSLEKLIAKYKSIKTACLQQMFPQNGETVPRMRLLGFTGAWEQRKFDEVFDCTVPNNTLSRAELSYDEGTVLNVHYGDVLIKYGSVLDVQKDDIPRIPHRCREDFNGALLQDGDVIIADTAEDETTGKACEIGNLQGRAIVSGLHTMVCRPRHRMALGYLGYYLNSNAYHHQLLPLMQGIKVLSLSRSNIQKTSVSYPSAVKEQQLIASYFSQLDHLITLHQRKLEKIQKIKQGMMQQLLTGKIRLV